MRISIFHHSRFITRENCPLILWAMDVAPKAAHGDSLRLVSTSVGVISVDSTLAQPL